MAKVHPERIAPHCRSAPMNDREMIELWNAGTPMSAIAAKAKRRNGLSIGEVREIVLGRPD